MKKTYKLLALLLIISILLCSCSSTTNMDNNIKNEIEGTITLWSHGSYYEYLKYASKKYMELHTKAKVEVKDVDSSYMDENFPKVLEGKRTGPDLVVMSCEEVQYYSAKYPLAFREMNEFIAPYRDNVNKQRLEKIVINDKVMALPWDNLPVTLYYNANLIKKYGIDPESMKTWKDFIKAGEVLYQSNKGQVKLIGYDKDIYSMYQLLLSQLNLGVFNESGESNVNQEKSVRVLELMRELNSKSFIDFSKDDKELIDKIKNQQIAFTISSNLIIDPLEENFREDNNKLGMMALPAFEPGGNRSASYSGNNMMMLESTKNVKLCESFMKFALIDKENLIEGIKQFSILSVYNKVNTDAIFDEPYEILLGFRPWRFLERIQKEAFNIKYTYKQFSMKKNMKDIIEKLITGNENIRIEVEKINKDLEKLGK